MYNTTMEINPNRAKHVFISQEQLNEVITERKTLLPEDLNFMDEFQWGTSRWDTERLGLVFTVICAKWPELNCACKMVEINAKFDSQLYTYFEALSECAKRRMKSNGELTNVEKETLGL